MAECRSNAEPQQKANPASGKPTFTCFSCGQAGHKSPDCPKRNRKEPDEKKKDTARKTLKNNFIMTEDCVRTRADILFITFVHAHY